MLWRINEHCHLLGSIHASDGQPNESYPEHERAYHDSSAIIVEHDLDRDLRHVGRYQGSYFNLRRTLASDFTDRVLERAIAVEANAGFINSCKPWKAGMCIAIATLVKAGFDFGAGIDSHYASRAKLDGKTVDFLEDAESALMPYEAMPEEKQIHLLIRAVTEPDILIADMRGLIGAWRQGDLPFVEHYLEKRLIEMHELFVPLVFGRNREWLTSLKTPIASPRSTLIIVGVLHCVGQNGLPTLLRQEGHEVKRLR